MLSALSEAKNILVKTRLHNGISFYGFSHLPAFIIAKIKEGLRVTSPINRGASLIFLFWLGLLVWSYGVGNLQSYQSRGFGALNPSLDFQIPFAFLTTAQNKAVPLKKAFRHKLTFQPYEVAITMLQDDINILAAAVQWIDSSGKMVPNDFQKLRNKLGTGTLIASSRVGCCHVPRDVSAPCMAAATVRSQRVPLDQVPHPGWV